MRRFRCDAIPEPGERTLLDAEVSHHLLLVTRVPRGHQVERFDGDALGLRLRVDLLLLLARYDDDDWLGPD